jgi:replicative DNA helicase
MDLLGCENSVAGSILISPSCLSLAAASLEPSDFALSGARSVFETALLLSAEGGQIDAVTVQARARKNGINLSNSYLAELMNSTPSAAHVESYIELVKSAAIKRRLLELCRSAEESADEGKNAEELYFELSESLKTMNYSGRSKALMNSAELFESWGKYCQKRDETRSGAVFKTGFPELDAILGSGMANGGLYIIGGRPGMGKTTLSLAVALNAVKSEKPVLFVSLEMSCVQIASKLISALCGLPYCGVYHGKLSESDTKKAFAAAAFLSKLPIFLCSRPQLNVAEIVMLARSIKGLGAVIIDYIGLVSPQGGKSSGRYELISEISGSFKRAAAALSIPFICVSQLNRELSSRKSKRPQLTDLRDSGSIEQDADGVILLHRPSYYEGDYEESRTSDFETIELIVAKNRHGTTGSCEMLWDNTAGRFLEKRL